MSTRHRKTNGTQEGLSSKKSPETQQKEAQHAPFDVMLGFSSLVSANKPPAMLVEAKCFSFKLKKKTSCSKMEVVWRPHPKYRRNER